MSSIAPIVLFCYDRPWHTEQTLEALTENKLSAKSKLFVFCDGPKPQASKEKLQNIKEVNRIVQSRNWCKKVTIFSSSINIGLANSVIKGVTEVVNKYGKVIVLEDDLVCSEYFLEYMNESLNRYEKCDEVMQISAHQFPVQKWGRNNESFFMPFTTSWGWATWDRAWKHFNEEAIGYEKLNEDQELKRKFDLNNSYPYTAMLKSQMEDKTIDSWAIRWWWSVFKERGITLFPDFPLVDNIGFDNTATHTIGTPYVISDFQDDYKIAKYPDVVIPDLKRYSEVCWYLSQPKNDDKRLEKSLLQKIIKFLLQKF